MPLLRSARSQRLLACLAALTFSTAPLRALTATGYTATTHDRFTGGMPSAPVLNTDPTFIAADYDLTGVGWSATDARKGFGFITPQHYLVARHYGGATTINILGGDGELHSYTQSSVTQTGMGLLIDGQNDLSLGTLSTPVASSAQMARYGVLDLHATSSGSSLNNYAGLSLLMYGRGATSTSSPRVGNASILTVNALVNDENKGVLVTNRDDVQLQSLDSGSPTFVRWVNPNGDAELSLVGNHAAIDTTNGYNFDNFIARADVIATLNALTTPDGFAIRVVGNPHATWSGSAGATLSLNASWGLSGGPNQIADKYVLFDASTSAGRTANVSAATNLRGLYFKATAAANDGFTLSGANTLTIGRGGVTNYDDARQTITAAITLGDHQYWDTGPGGVTTGAINTNGKLLEIAGGAAKTVLGGVVSGSGGLAVTSGEVELTHANTYTGATWVHSGLLRVNGSLATASVVRLGAEGTLAGSGSVGHVSGTGLVAPGNSPGILTATSIDPSQGMDFAFEFTSASAPDFANPAASLNDVLRLTAATPFTTSLTAANTVNIYLNVESLSIGDIFLGGFFVDTDPALLFRIEQAAFNFYLRDVGGPVLYGDTFYRHYTGALDIEIGVQAIVASFISGDVEGNILSLAVVPEPSAAALLAAAASILAAIRRRPRTPSI